MKFTDNSVVHLFQLTRSVGSVTLSPLSHAVSIGFQLTRSVGSVTSSAQNFYLPPTISTHTLRGERDLRCFQPLAKCNAFQLTRSVGSVTGSIEFDYPYDEISTHTLRGERDLDIFVKAGYITDFNSHAPWGA